MLLMLGCSDVAMDDNAATVQTRAYTCPDCGLTGICACDKDAPEEPVLPDQTYTLTQWYYAYPANYKVTATVFFNGTYYTSQITNVSIDVYNNGSLDDMDMVWLNSKSYSVNYNKVTVNASGTYGIYIDAGPMGDSGWDTYPFGNNFTVSFTFRSFY